MYVGLSYVESITTLHSGTFDRNFSSVDSPSPSDMRMSNKITSGLSFWANRRASLPLDASPIISMSVPANRLARPVRMTSWSSQTKSRILIAISRKVCCWIPIQRINYTTILIHHRAGWNTSEKPNNPPGTAG